MNCHPTLPYPNRTKRRSNMIHFVTTQLPSYQLHSYIYCLSTTTTPSIHPSIHSSRPAHPDSRNAAHLAVPFFSPKKNTQTERERREKRTRKSKKKVHKTPTLKEEGRGKRRRRRRGRRRRPNTVQHDRLITRHGTTMNKKENDGTNNDANEKKEKKRKKPPEID